MSQRPQVYVTHPLPEAARRIIDAACDARYYAGDPPVPREILMREAAASDGILTLLTDRVDAELLDAAPRCRAVANLAVGVDNIDLEAARARGVTVTNTPGVLTETTADLAFALILASARRLFEAGRFLREGRWRTWSLMMLTGQDVYGATLGIIGMGRIGAAVARRARGFNMKVLYHNRRRQPEWEAETGAAYCSLDELLQQSDFVSLHTPLTPQTRGLIGARELALMKPAAILINTARGAVVDEAALIEALRQRRIGGAGLDVFEREPVAPDHPLLQLDNVVALPHIGSATVATRTRMAVMAAENLAAAVTGQEPPNRVV